MFNSIVVGTDGSTTAAEAVRKAVELARSTSARLHLVTAYRSAQATSAMAMVGASAATGVAVDVSALSAELHEEAEEILQRALPDGLGDGVDVDRHARAGNPAEVILAVADEVDADLIVVGNRGMHGPRRFLLGSVPNRVAHSSACSVMIVHTC